MQMLYDIKILNWDFYHCLSIVGTCNARTQVTDMKQNVSKIITLYWSF